MSRVLTIFEVSQKQAFIFSSNKLKDNIRNSDIIAMITGKDYIAEKVGDKTVFNPEKNLVYAGGGHTILVFDSMDQAKKVTEIVTLNVLREFPDVELFATSVIYDESLSAGENVRELKKALETKKALRKASFHQGSFGIEVVDTNTGKPRRCDHVEENIKERNPYIPDRFLPVQEFEKLGGKKGENNFIAVVHIDGNGMGKRIEEFEDNLKTWDEYRIGMRKYSEAITEHFMQAYDEMTKTVEKFLNTEGADKELDLSYDFAEKKMYFPVRRIITEGDDICFITNGKIGIECARVFLEKLSEIKGIDKKPYAACAGVAIVHQKYPFYRAYELAEELCKSAKKAGANISKDTEMEDNGASISSIDWHIEYGELKDSIKATRRQYMTNDDKHMELRPYLVAAPEMIMKREAVRNFENFRLLMGKILGDKSFYAAGALKEFRFALKKGEQSSIYYLNYHNMDKLRRDAYQDIYEKIDYRKLEVGSGNGLDRKLFIKTSDGAEHSTVFDAIEIMDTYALLEG